MTNYSNGENTRRIILRAAGRLFWEKGYAATTFEDICRQAHVKRSTISYHFKTKDHLLEQYRDYISEKTILAAGYCCQEPSYTYILAESIYWYYIQHDNGFFRIATEFARLELLQRRIPKNRYENLISCYLPALLAAGIERPQPIHLTEVCLRGLEYAPLLLGAVIEEETLEQLMEDYIKMVGRICGLPDFISEQTWQEVRVRMSEIPYDALNIRWL